METQGYSICVDIERKPHNAEIHDATVGTYVVRRHVVTCDELITLTDKRGCT